jgi:hypothetical protein
VRAEIRKTKGGWHRQETIDYSDILDREAQQIGEDIGVFMEGLECARRCRATVADLERQSLAQMGKRDLQRMRLRGAVWQSSPRSSMGPPIVLDSP